MNGRSSGPHTSSVTNHTATNSAQNEAKLAHDFLIHYYQHYQDITVLDTTAASPIHRLPSELAMLVIKHHRVYKANAAAKIYYKIYQSSLREYRSDKNNLLIKLQNEERKIAEFLNVNLVAPDVSRLNKLAQFANTLKERSDSPSEKEAVGEKRKATDDANVSKKNKTLSGDVSQDQNAIIEYLVQDMKAIQHHNGALANSLNIIMKNPILRGYSDFEAGELEKVKAFVSLNADPARQAGLDSVERKYVTEATFLERTINNEIAAVEEKLQQLRLQLQAYIKANKDDNNTKKIKSTLTDAEKAQIATLNGHAPQDTSLSLSDLHHAYQQRDAKIKELQRELRAEQNKSKALTQELKSANDRLETFIDVNGNDLSDNQSLRAK